MLEVDLYLTVSAVRAAMQECDGDMAAAVGRYAGTVMAAALAREEELIARRLPAACRARRDAAPAGRPRRRPRRVRAAVDPGAAQLERRSASAPSPTSSSTPSARSTSIARTSSSTPSSPPTEDCPACQGQAFGYPSSLEDAKESLCAPHKAAAKVVNTERIAHARHSNPAGWRAIDKAVMRINKLPEPIFAPQPPRVVGETPARNDPCFCGSGKKYKKCHGA